ncbi:galanin receptor 2a-like [Antedon mediterranea]|uniref:galanin receptor 2a-like n=1 Tax=Antedon mediterranea TaxID=105859 RepID=UPI003AF70170
MSSTSPMPCDSRETPSNATWFTVTECILAIIGIVGNLLVIHIYKNKNMNKSSTSFFIVSLAFADLISSANMLPLHMLYNDVNNIYFCRFVSSGYLLWTSICASSLLLMILTLDRYSAVLHPAKHKQTFSRSRCWILVIIVWFSAAIFNTFNIWINVLDNCTCTVRWPGKYWRTFIGIFNFLTKYTIPVVVMISANYTIIRSLKRQVNIFRRKTSSINSPAITLHQAKRDIMKTVFVVTVTFIMCWSTEQMCFFIHAIGLFERYAKSNLENVLVLLGFVNSCANPFIYITTNKQFNKHFRKLLLKFQVCNPVSTVDLDRDIVK